jgi:maltose alpha-D-glucosyltransferase / alpha-amylase
MSLRDDLRLGLPPQLPAFLMNQRWFGGKAREIQSAELVDLVPVGTNQLEAFVLLVRVAYTEGASETYIIPIASADDLIVASPGDSASLVIAGRESQKHLITDALRDEAFLLGLLDAIEAQSVWQGMGQIRAVHTDVFEKLRSDSAAFHPAPLKGEQSNTSIKYGDRFILKLFRRLEEGINPDLEIGLFLTEKAHFANAPRVAGSLSYHAEHGEPATLGILHEFVPNRGDAWRFTMDALSDFWKQASAYSVAPPRGGFIQGSSPPSGQDNTVSMVVGLIATYLDAVGLLGKRTAELHIALASELGDSDFAPEPYTGSFQQAFAKSARELTERNFGLLRAKLCNLPEPMRDQVAELLPREAEIDERFHATTNAQNRGMRIRIHGDYHLGQVLYTGSDFVVIDFEGEPLRSISQRRIKRSPLQDVASMLRSFHYAAFAQLLAPIGGTVRPADFRTLVPWADIWYAQVTARYLTSYLQAARLGGFLPPDDSEISAILKLHLLEKAIYELGYELNNRPAWVAIPLAGISKLLDE